MTKYNPFISGQSIRGSQGFAGQLAGIREKAIDYDKLKDYVRGATQDISGVVNQAGLTNMLTRGAGLGLAGLASKYGILQQGGLNLLGMSLPPALLLAGLAAGATSFGLGKRRQKKISGLSSQAPKLKYGKSDLKDAVDRISSNVQNIEASIAPTALSTGAGVITNKLKMDLLANQFNKLTTGVGNEVGDAINMTSPVNQGFSDYIRPRDMENLIQSKMLGSQNNIPGYLQNLNFLKNPYNKFNLLNMVGS